MGDSRKPLLAIQPIEELCRPPCAVCRVPCGDGWGKGLWPSLAGLAAVVDAASSNEQGRHAGHGAALRSKKRAKGGLRTRCSKREKALPHDS